MNENIKQYGQALSAYNTVIKSAPNYRDVQNRIQLIKSYSSPETDINLVVKKLKDWRAIFAISVLLFIMISIAVVRTRQKRRITEPQVAEKAKPKAVNKARHKPSNQVKTIVQNDRPVVENEMGTQKDKKTAQTVMHSQPFVEEKTRVISPNSDSASNFSPSINLWSVIGGAASLTILVILTLFDLVNLIYIFLPISILSMIVLLSNIQRRVSKKFTWNFHA